MRGNVRGSEGERCPVRQELQRQKQTEEDIEKDLRMSEGFKESQKDYELQN